MRELAVRVRVASVKLTVVGCSGSFPGPDSAASCYLVEAPYEGRTYRLVLDLGSGAFGALQRYVDPYAIDAVGLSHLHPDHCFDLCAYYVARKYHPDGHQPQIPVYGPFGTADRMAAAYGLPAEPGMRGEFDFRAWLGGDGCELGPFTVKPVPVVHPVEAYAIRLEHAGKVLVYSGDTAPTDALLELAQGADLFLCEATVLVGQPHQNNVHLTAWKAAEYAARARVGRLVLTHVPPWNDRTQTLAQALPAYDGPTDLATPGAVYEL